MVTFDQLGTARSEVPPPDYPWSQERGREPTSTPCGRASALNASTCSGTPGAARWRCSTPWTSPHRVGRLVLSNTASSVAQHDDRLPPPARRLLPAAEAAERHHCRCARRPQPTRVPPRGAQLAGALLGRRLRHASPGASSTRPSNPTPGARRALGQRRLWFADGAARNWDVEPRLAEIDRRRSWCMAAGTPADFEVNPSSPTGLPDCTWIILPRGGHDMFNGPQLPAYLTVIDSFLRGWTAHLKEQLDEQLRARSCRPSRSCAVSRPRPWHPPRAVHSARSSSTQEIDVIFGRSWLLRVPRVRAGEARLATSRSTPATTASSSAGRRAARSLPFTNVCRHRGSRLIDAGCGITRRFVCPYHRGPTASTAGCRVRRRCRPVSISPNTALTPVHVASWNGLVP